MQVSNNVEPACMLYFAADPIHGLVTQLPFVKCTVSILKITAYLQELGGIEVFMEMRSSESKRSCYVFITFVSYFARALLLSTV